MSGASLISIGSGEPNGAGIECPKEETILVDLLEILWLLGLLSIDLEPKLFVIFISVWTFSASC
jgi:hypothetical protein